VGLASPILVAIAIPPVPMVYGAWALLCNPAATESQDAGRFANVPKSMERNLRHEHLVSVQLLRSAEKDRLYDGFNPDGHLLGGDTVGGLKPATRGSNNGPGCGGRQQCRIDPACRAQPRDNRWQGRTASVRPSRLTTEASRGETRWAGHPSGPSPCSRSLCHLLS